MNSKMLIQDLLQMISKEVKEEKIVEGRPGQIGDALDKFIDDNKLYSFEGTSGIRKFEKITSALGYHDIHEFLADNSGCFEVMVEWIKSQRNDEWFEKLDGVEEIDEAIPPSGAKKPAGAKRSASDLAKSIEYWMQSVRAGGDIANIQDALDEYNSEIQKNGLTKDVVYKQWRKDYN